MARVEAMGSKKTAEMDSVCTGSCFMLFAFCLLTLTSYKVIRLFVTTMKLKSSPRQKEERRIDALLGN